MGNCLQQLDESLRRALAHLDHSFIENEAIAARVQEIVSCPSNRSGARLLMACMLAKIDRPEIDPRKPYTKIGSKDCYSGRTYDEQYIGDFIRLHNLPCNATTAFLTPTLRNMDQTLTAKIVLVGRPSGMYQSALMLLDDVHKKKISAQKVLDESIRLLLIERNARKQRISTLLTGIGRSLGQAPLSSEDTVLLIEQHLRYTKQLRTRRDRLTLFAYSAFSAAWRKARNASFNP